MQNPARVLDAIRAYANQSQWVAHHGFEPIEVAEPGIGHAPTYEEHKLVRSLISEFGQPLPEGGRPVVEVDEWAYGLTGTSGKPDGMVVRVPKGARWPGDLA